MTKTELIQQALDEYQTAYGRPCSNSVIIATTLNEPQFSTTVNQVQVAKPELQLADEQAISAALEAKGHTKPFSKGQFEGLMRDARASQSQAEKFDAISNWIALQEMHKAAGDEYHYRDDFGEPTITVEQTTTVNLGSRADQAGVGVVTSKDVIEVMRSGQ